MISSKNCQNANRLFSLPRNFNWFISLALIAKLVLCSKEEIIAFDLSHDDLWQICSSENWYFFGNYKWDTLLHLPIYPLFIKLVSLTGVPLRVAIELLFCGSAWLLMAALWHLGCTPLIASLAGLAALFHPASFQLPNRVGAEVLLSPLLMGAIASSILWWNTRNTKNQWRYSVYSSIWWAMACNVRKESILIFGFLALFALFVVIADKKMDRKQILSRISYGIIFPILAGLFLSFLIKGGNYLRWGIFADSILTAPGYTSAYRALQSIPPVKHIDFIAVPVEVRERAYHASHSFAELRPYLEGSVGANWARISRTNFTDPIGMKELDSREIASGWFYWALHDTAIAAGYTQARQEDLFFKRVANEINQAQDAGLVERRLVPIAFIDPAWLIWLPRLPESFRKVIGVLFTPTTSNSPINDATSIPFIKERFDHTANRRRHLLDPPKASLSGWIVSSNGNNISLSIDTLSDKVVTETIPTIMRPDINTKIMTGFYLEAYLSSYWDWDGSLLGIRDGSQGKITIPLTELQIGQVLSKSIGNDNISIGLDIVANPVLTRHWTWTAQSSFEKLYLQFTKTVSWFILLYPMALMWLKIRKRPFPSTIVAVGLISAMIFERLLFFAILDASSWPGNQARYVYPIMPLFGALLILIFAQVATTCFPRIETMCWRKSSQIVITKNH